MPQSNHRKKGGGINEREPSAFIAYTYDSKTMPPCKMQSAKQKVLDEITGFARSRHPVKVHCYQWTTSNYKWRAMLPPGWSLHQLVTALYRCSRRRYCLSPKKERASDHLAIQQFTKVHSRCSPSNHSIIRNILPKIRTLTAT